VSVSVTRVIVDDQPRIAAAQARYMVASGIQNGSPACYQESGGRYRTRTDDLFRVKEARYQLRQSPETRTASNRIANRPTTSLDPDTSYAPRRLAILLAIRYSRLVPQQCGDADVAQW
jgi:hypothetical protein